LVTAEAPYAYSNNDRFEQLRFSLEAGTQSANRAFEGSEAAGQRGCLYCGLRGSPKGWPDFIDDVVATSHSDRPHGADARPIEPTEIALAHSVKDGRITRARAEGNRLGLCRPEVWAMAWDPGQAENTEETRPDASRGCCLDQLGSRSSFLDGSIGVFLLKEPPDKALIRKGRDTKILRSVSCGSCMAPSTTLSDGLEALAYHRIDQSDPARRRPTLSRKSTWGLDSLL